MAFSLTRIFQSPTARSAVEVIFKRSIIVKPNTCPSGRDAHEQGWMGIIGFEGICNAGSTQRLLGTRSVFGCPDLRLGASGKW